MICTVTGFYLTGSSAISDIIRECDGIYIGPDYEIRFAHDPDGISDLEYNIIENPSRHNGSTAIKRFLRSMEKLDHVYWHKRYSKILDPDFQRHSIEYVDNITAFAYPGFYHYDIWERNKLFYACNGIVNKCHIGRRNLLPKDELNYFLIYEENAFLKYTKEFTGKVLNALNVNNFKNIFFDQLVPPSNIKRYSRYFDNMSVIVVERDPRDVFILSKYILRDHIAPDDVKIFCKWFQWVREICKDSVGSSILKIQFEDLVYNYDETMEKILCHYKIKKKQHVFPRKYFMPEISIKNTQLWRRYSGFEKETEYIRKTLAQYCYCFPNTRVKVYRNKGFNSF